MSVTRHPRLRPLVGPALSLLALVLAALPAAAADDLAPLEPSKDQAVISGRILNRLSRGHYRQQAFDDAFSEHLFERYLEALDPGRLFLLAGDVAEFKAWEHELDDALLDGDLEPVYAIFNRNRERRLERLDTLLAALDERLDGLSFDGDQELEIDRSKAPWPADQAQAEALWQLRFENDVLGLRLADRDTDQIRDALRRRYENQRHRLAQVDADDVFRIWMNVVTQSYDPHTEFFPPRDAENFDIAMSLSLEGIGALLGSDGEYCKVERIIPGGPADRDGRLQPADRIIGVAQGTEHDAGELVDVVGWRNDEIVELIRGPKDTTVCLQVLPAEQGDAATPRVIEILRDKVKLEEQSARSRVVEIVREDGPWRVGVIDLPTFYIDFEAARSGDPDYKSATRDVAKLVEELQTEGVQGLVMDLRGNGGGSLREAQELTGLFLGGGPVVQIRGGDGRVELAGAPNGPPLWDGPLVVLVDRLSASASEIFAAAVQDTGRGVIVGSNTFGKGTVQGLVPLEDGQLKITQAMFYRLSGDSTQGQGVAPDVRFPSLYDADEIGESSLPDTLPWERIPAAHVKKAGAPSTLAGRLQSLHESREAGDPELTALNEQLAYGNSMRARETVSLNEAQRRAEADAIDARLLEIENAKRLALGEEPVASLDQVERDRDAIDPYAREAAQVLVDFVLARDELRLARRPQLR